ncbi:zinc finger MYM-type protein 5-like [Hydra vulgaris]|uniref:Zinc finger MYM-type protein 5-like n=1 Tax=Hydra vulgaris TaxID=6087 RepID=A0ABM4DQ87_HYDVU
MSIRKGGWERAKELEKKMHDEDKLLKKIPKINSFFTATNKVDATDNITLNSPPSSSTSQVGIDHKEEAAKIALELENTEKFEDRADTGSGTIPNDVGSFGDIKDHVRNMCISLGTIHFRNLADSYPETKREYSGVNCFLNSSVFKRVLPNGDIVDRDWLVYSPAKTCVFRFPCILFSSDRSQLSGSGFKDWKNMTQYLKSHEISAKHIQSVLTLCQRSVAAGRVDEQLHNNMLRHCNYWRNVLSRCVATITFLCERGLPLRGSNEVVGSRENGNYLGILELIGQFDPFLSQHICTHGNCRRRHTSYLSKTICGELIAMMGKQVMGFIKDEIPKSRYFS